jgi:non-specific protein-tyrosine kinase
MDLRRQIVIVRHRLPVLIACVLLAAAAAFGYSSLQQPLYEAKATLIVGQSLSAVNPDINQLLASQRLSTTYASVATTRPILENVVKQLGLDMSADGLRGRVVADTPQSNTLLTITARDPDPARAAAIANALADQLIAASPAIQGRQAEVQASIDKDLKAPQDQIDTTQARVEVLTGLPDRTAEQDAELLALDGRLASLRAAYATLLSYSSGSGSSMLSVVEPAVAPGSPVSPKTQWNTLLAAVVGLLVGAAIIFVWEYLDDAVRDAETVQEVTGLGTLGTIPRMKSGKEHSEIYRLATLLYPRSGVTEAYRKIRTSIEFASVDAPTTTLLVTSANPGDGKTVTAANLAVVFAQAGRRVLLVDADLRKPGIHRIFDLPNAHGLTTLLRSDDVSLDAIAHVTEQENLRIITTGPLPPNPAELLGSQRMRRIVDRLLSGEDLVIFDSAPVRAVADAAVLSSFVNGVVLVVDAGHSRRDAVRQARETLATAGANVLGVVVNRVRAADRQSDYDYGYGEAYGPEAWADTRAQGT